jgi:hypothetical protein
LAAVVLVLLVGWIVANVVKNLVNRILDVLQVDTYAERVGVDKIFAKGGIKYSISELIGVLSYWVVILISLVIAVGVVNQNGQAAGLLNTIVLYIPRVISAVFILIVGLFFATFVSTAIQTAAANAGVDQAMLLGRLSQAVLIVFTFDIALRQIQIDIRGIENAVMILLASAGLALALAFGLGCKDIAGRLTQEFLDKMKPKK